jgi:two-component sensor histidine kinase/sensor domain CHASE-containing protein
MLRRILLFTGITLVVMLLLITFATRSVLEDGFSRLEKEFLERNVARVENAISDQIAALSMVTSDWATWDETYRFVLDRNTRYIESNLGNGTFVDLHLSIVLFLDRSGKRVFSETFDPMKGIRRKAPVNLIAWLEAHPFMTRLTGKSSHAEGIIPLPEGPLLTAARPILDSKGKGTVRGTLLLGRFLDAQQIEKISSSLRLSVSLSPLSDKVMSTGKEEGASGAQTGTQVFIDTRREDVISGSSVLRAADGSPALMLNVEFPRDIHRQGVATSRYFIMWLLVISVVFSVVVLLVIQLTVLSRLEQLSAGVLAIGTGSEPGRRVSVKGRDQIAYLGAAINGMLEALEGSHEQLRQSELRNAGFLDAIPDVILRVTRDGAIIDGRFPSRSRLAARPDAFIGVQLSDLAAQFPPVSPQQVADAQAAIHRALEGGLPVVLEFTLDLGKGAQYFQAHFAASGDAEVIVVTREVTAEKRVEEAQQHEILVKEIHHRVKNNLQVISSLLSLQASAASDLQTRSLLNESRNRVRSMALIHEKLYQSGGGPGGGYAQYVRDLADQLLNSYKGEAAVVGIGIEVDDIPMDLDLSVPVGLIVNELLTNALAHAFPQGRPGRITVVMRRIKGGQVQLAVNDDGIGFPTEIDYRNPTSLGLRIVNILVQQIRGSLTLETAEGTTFRVIFPAG